MLLINNKLPILLRERATNIHLLIKQTTQKFFALQWAPTLLVHFAGSLITALCPRSLDYHSETWATVIIKNQRKEKNRC